MESYKVGIRKPNPKIFNLALKELNLKGNECIFLDDIGANLKPAREMVFYFFILIFFF